MVTNAKLSTVRLVEFDEKYTDRLSEFSLPDDQLMFTSMPLEKIKDPNLSSNTKHILILDREEPVGYFALEDGEKLRKYTKNASARVLTAFSIDMTHQGKGLAKAALHLLPEFVKVNLPTITEVVLGVNQRNQAAMNLYLKSGFADENEVYEGPKGPQSVLHLKI